ncbi:UDP-N-acetylglucosamine 1-carboxyvinyltransferase [Lacunimicrobium album]
MDLFIIQGGTRLSGVARVHGSKNAALPIMAASILTDAPLTLTNIPDLADIRSMLALLDRLGVSMSANLASSRLTLQADDPSSFIAPYDLVRKMRASICVLGPLLAKRKKAIVSLPGGCAIGHRPIDLHLKGLAALGVDLRIERGYVIAQAEHLTGTTIDLAGPNGTTVTGTCNLLCAATLAKGTTVLTSAAREPEVIDLGELLIKMGAKIEGLGTSTLTIHAVTELGAATHEVIPDRIEAATLLIAGAITGGEVTLEKVRADHLTSVVDALARMGCIVQNTHRSMTIKTVEKLSPIDLATGPYPAFPTDVQAQLMALATLAPGKSRIVETVFPDRFMHVSELVRLGAQIEQHGSTAIINGCRPMNGAPLMASDLRASAALILAALASQGETVLRRIYHLDRGYQRLDETLNQLGAKITRVADVPENLPEESIPGSELLAGPHWLTKPAGVSESAEGRTSV